MASFLDIGQTNNADSTFSNVLSRAAKGGGEWNGIKPPSGGWSSLIGIITAICGNVLISFALNTQRYAHLRISQQRDEETEKWRAERKRKRISQNGHGQHLGQDDVENGRNTDSTQNGGASENTPLIPKANGVAHISDSESEDEEQQDGSKEDSYLKSPIWWLGIALMTVGEAGNFLAYGFAPASIVSPMGVVALVSNCLIAPLLLGERFRWRDGVGVIIAIAGCVTIVLSASTSNPKLTPDDIWRLITYREFEIYLGVTVFLIIALVVASNRYGHRSILIDLGLVGLFGGYTALSTKGIASLLSNKVWRVITFPITYLLLAVLVSTAILQIKYVNRALQNFNATMVIPTQFVLFTISVIVGSAVLYQDFRRQSREDAIKFFAGCALTFLGVWCITSGRSEDDHDEESGDEHEDIDIIDEQAVQRDIRNEQFARERFAHSQAQMEELRAKNESRAPLVRITSGSELSSSTDPYRGASTEPLVRAAIHSDMAVLPGPPRPGPVHATVSDPTIPTIGASQKRPTTPLGRSRTHKDTTTPQNLPLTPRNNTLEASTSSQRLLPRATLFPGPLMSPLSSSLSAVVADSLRRGVDTSSAASLRRRRSSNFQRTRQNRPQSTVIFSRAGSKVTADGPARKRHSIASGEMDFDESTLASLRARGGGSSYGAGTSADSTMAVESSSRSRSLSATLGDMFGPMLKKKRTNVSNGEAADR